MPAAKIAYAKQETYAFEKHYYELVSFPTPVALLFDEFALTMERNQKSYIAIPARYSVLKVPLVFVFRLETKDAPVYYYEHVLAENKIIRRYNPERNYLPGGR